MNSILLSIAAFFVLALSALFAAPYVVDWNDYRHVFEAQLTNLLGRQILVAGDVNLRLLPSPYVRFENISLAGRERNIEQPLLKAKAITLWLTVPPLLRGKVEAKEMEVTEPHISLRILADGKGNWTSLGANSDAQNFVAEQIALETVQIDNAIVEVSHRPGSRPLVFEFINGTLSARTLQGPYNFSGRFNYDGMRREIQFSTSRHTAGGAMRLKSALRVLSTGITYTVDGQLTDLGKRPQFTAALIARIPKDGEAGSEMKLLPSDVTGTQLLADGQAIEVRSILTASLERATFKDVKILFANHGQPQSLEGEATVDWNNGLNLNIRLRSKWLDVDRLLAEDKSGKVSVRDAVAFLIDKYQRYQSTFDRAAININVSQATLEGDLIKALDLHIAKDGDKILLSKLTAELPGVTKLKMRGQINLNGEQPGFAGPVHLKGRDLYRFARWAVGGAKKQATPRNDHYSVQAMVTFAPGVIEVEDVEGEIAESAFSGKFRYHFDSRREFVLELDSNRFDLGMISGDPVSLKLLTSSLWRGDGKTMASGGSGGAESKSLAEFLRTASGHIKVRVGQLVLPGLKARDVDVRARLVDGTFEIASLNLDTEDGVSIRGDGKVEQLGAAAEGKIQFVVDSEGPAGLQSLGKFLGLPVTVTDNETLLKALSPLRVAVALQTGLDGQKATRILIDGAAASSRLSIKAQHKGSPSNIGSKPFEISASLTNPNGGSLVKQVFRRARSGRFTSAGEGILALHAIGIPSEGLNTLIELDAAGLRGGFEGTILIAAGASEFDGIVGLTAERAEDGLAIFGIDNFPGADRQQLSLRAMLKKKGDKYDFADVTASVGATVAEGNAVVDTGQSPAQFDVSVAANRAYLPHLMSLLLKDEIPSIVAAAKNATEGTDSNYWPERIFNHDIFRHVEGRLKLKAKTLNITDRLTLTNGALTIEQRGGVLKIAELTGSLFGGSLSATGRFVPNRSGVAFEGTGRLADAALGELAKTNKAQPLASGKMSLELALKGQGRSPRGLVSALSGEGSIRFSDGQILSLSPAALPALVKRPAKLDDIGLTERFKKTLNLAAFPYKAFKISVNVADGTLKVAGVPLRSGKTTLKISSLIDVARLRFDGTLTVRADIPGTRQPSPPPVNLVFAGPLSELGRLTPTIDAKSLKRYLTVRRMERDVEQLEKLEREGRSSSLGVAPNSPFSSSSVTAVRGTVSGGPRQGPVTIPAATNSIAPAKGDAPSRPSSWAPIPPTPSAPVTIPVRPAKPDQPSVSDTAWKAVPNWAIDLSTPAPEPNLAAEPWVPTLQKRRKTKDPVREKSTILDWNNPDSPLASD